MRPGVSSRMLKREASFVKREAFFVLDSDASLTGDVSRLTFHASFTSRWRFTLHVSRITFVTPALEPRDLSGHRVAWPGPEVPARESDE